MSHIGPLRRRHRRTAAIVAAGVLLGRLRWRVVRRTGCGRRRRRVGRIAGVRARLPRRSGHARRRSRRDGDRCPHARGVRRRPRGGRPPDRLLRRHVRRAARRSRSGRHLPAVLPVGQPVGSGGRADGRTRVRSASTTSTAGSSRGTARANHWSADDTGGRMTERPLNRTDQKTRSAICYRVSDARPRVPAAQRPARRARRRAPVRSRHRFGDLRR